MSPEELFNEYQHLGKQTIYHMYNNPKGICQKHRIELDDLLQYAATGLWKACLSFDPDKGTKFQTHAINHIKWHLNERLNRETSMIKYSVNRDYSENEIYGIISMDASISDLFDGEPKNFHDVVASDTDVQNDVMGNLGGEYILSRLTDKQRKVVELAAKGFNGSEIGRVLNMTGANAREHFNKSKNRLMKYQLGVV